MTDDGARLKRTKDGVRKRISGVGKHALNLINMESNFHTTMVPRYLTARACDVVPDVSDVFCDNNLR